MSLGTPVVRRAFRIVQVATRAASVPGMTVVKGPVIEGTPPSIEEYNHLDPKGWQLGADGKILPRLPEGTKIGKLVMGKYGLYSPEKRRLNEAFREAMERGENAESWRPFDRMVYNGLRIGGVFMVIITIWNFVQMAQDEPIWPYKGHKVPEI